MKLSARIVSLIAVFALFAVAPTFAQTTGSTTLTLQQQLDIQKNLATQSIDAAVQQFTATTLSWANSIEQNAQYQSLVCLGILEDKRPSLEFTKAVAKLKTDMLEDYSNQKSQIDRLNLWLSVDRERLEVQIKNFASIYATLTTQLINTYTDDLEILRTNVNQYGAANTDLLASVNGKVVQLNSIMQKFAALDDLVFQFNNLFLTQQGNILDTLSTQRNEAQKLLSEKIQEYITTQAKRYPALLWYANALQSRKTELVRLYGLDFDEWLEDVVGSRYSRAAHDLLKQQIASIKSAFYEGETLKCQNILTSSMDVDGYVTVTSANINDMNRRLLAGISALQTTGSAEQIKTAVLNTFKSFYGDRIDAELAKMRSFAAEQASLFTTRSAQQSEQLTSLQDMKKRLDAAKTDAEKSEIRSLLIAQWKELYDAAVSSSVKDTIGSILTSLGVDLAPPAENAEWQPVETNNIFFPIIVKMAKNASSPTTFVTWLQNAIAKLDAKAQTASPSDRLVIQQIKEAIQLYVASN